ncbi:uncharacterized protein [Dermacentor albipictus]|uniref:uncharacterized protein isoform X2 n=1 Tax=Dermacentor albipictus TaxID=60249 RepID=UPI0031FE0274
MTSAISPQVAGTSIEEEPWCVLDDVLCETTGVLIEPRELAAADAETVAPKARARYRSIVTRARRTPKVMSLAGIRNALMWLPRSMIPLRRPSPLERPEYIQDMDSGLCDRSTRGCFKRQSSSEAESLKNILRRVSQDLPAQLGGALKARPCLTEKTVSDISAAAPRQVLLRSSAPECEFESLARSSLPVVSRFGPRWSTPSRMSGGMLSLKSTNTFASARVKRQPLCRGLFVSSLTATSEGSVENSGSHDRSRHPTQVPSPDAEDAAPPATVGTVIFEKVWSPWTSAFHMEPLVMDLVTGARTPKPLRQEGDDKVKSPAPSGKPPSGKSPMSVAASQKQSLEEPQSSKAPSRGAASVAGGRTPAAITPALQTIPGTPITPYTPELDSEIFEGPESYKEPEYELSDTTILDVNPSLLLPLSGCNFLIIIVSAIVFLGSVYAYFGRDKTETDAASPNTWLVYLLLNLELLFMFLSVVYFVTASIGFLGALRQNISLLDLYASLQGSLISCLLVLMFVVFFLPLIGREFVLSHITTDLIVHYRDGADYRAQIDYVQSSLRCCGVTDESYLDWNANAYFNCSPTNPSAERCSVPSSCCKVVAPGVYDDVPGPAEASGGAGADKSRAAKATSDHVDDVAVPSTLCGRGVMKLEHADAWKRVYTRGCGYAIFHYLESSVVEVVLYTLLLVLFHLTILVISIAVKGEIRALGKVYDKYYRVVYHGQARMKKMKAPELDMDLGAESARRAQGPPLVASVEVRRERHRRRYLGRGYAPPALKPTPQAPS